MKCRNKYKKYLEQKYKRIVPLDEDGRPREIEIAYGKDELLSEPQNQSQRKRKQRRDKPLMRNGISFTESMRRKVREEKNFQSSMMFHSKDRQRVLVQMTAQRQWKTYQILTSPEDYRERLKMIG